MTANPIIVGLGETLWDVFPEGAKFGGAPANFACSAAALAGPDVDVYMASAVGNDDLGDQAIDQLRQRKVHVDAVTRSQRPTGTVNVQLNDSGSATYQFTSDIAWDFLTCDSSWSQLAARTNAVCFGTLAQRSDQSSEAVLKFVDETPETSLKIFDINLRPPFWSTEVITKSLQAANALKLNDEELPVVAELCGASGFERDVLRQIQDHFDLQWVALTRGASGSVLVRHEYFDDLPGQVTEVVDTVGAGDAFTAALALGFLQGDDLHAINQRASKVAAFVCSKAGATPNFDELP